MDQRIPSIHQREFAVGPGPHTVAFRSHVGRIGCVILLGLAGLRFYFFRELLAALAVVTAVCAPMFIVFLIFILLHTVSHNRIAIGQHVKSTVSFFLKSCRGALHASTRKMMESLRAAALIASAKLPLNRPGS
jgi:hypothetical protein